MAEERDTLVGLYFHEQPLDRQGKIPGRQGMILGRVEGDHLLVRLFSWIGGDPTHLVCLPMEQVPKLVLFDDADEWRGYGERRRPGHKEGPSLTLLTVEDIFGPGNDVA